MRIAALPSSSRLTSKRTVAGALTALAVAIVLILAVFIPQADGARLAQLLVNGVITGSILALAGVGATLIFGIQRIANFAHGDFLTIGAYAAFVVNVGLGQNLLVAALSAMGAVALFGVAAHFVLFRPLRGRGTVAIALVSVGLGLLIRNVIFIIAGSQIRQFNVNQSEVFTIGVDPPLTRASGGGDGGVGGGAAGGALFGPHAPRQADAGGGRQSGSGGRLRDRHRAHRRLRLDPGRRPGRIGRGDARSEPGRLRSQYGVGAALSDLHRVVLGGIGSAYGALVAGLALGLAMELSTWDALFGGLDSKYKPVLAFVVLILLLLYRPQGVFGQARVL